MMIVMMTMIVVIIMMIRVMRTRVRTIIIILEWQLWKAVARARVYIDSYQPNWHLFPIVFIFNILPPPTRPYPPDPPPPPSSASDWVCRAWFITQAMMVRHRCIFNTLPGHRHHCSSERSSCSLSKEDARQVGVLPKQGKVGCECLLEHKTFDRIIAD